jgi:hypothetical protein
MRCLKGAQLRSRQACRRSSVMRQLKISSRNAADGQL